MSALANRVRKLEAASSSKSSRCITVFSNGATDEQIDEFLKSQGVELTKADLLVHIRTLFEAKGGGLQELPLKMRLGHISDTKK